ncbi:RNA-dependent RNA polymerase, partial [Arracacha latent virus E]
RKKNLIEFRYVNGSHCGFGSMVKLTSGLRALATVSHVWDAVKEVGYVQGRKGRVPTSNFRELYRHNDGDMVLLSTPDNRVDWASSIGVKACTMVPITDVHLGPHRMDFMNLEGKWFSQPCKIMGIDSFMLRTMCNTEPGYSGLPIYNPKGKIVALHSGAGPSKIENRASILLSITGLTSPRTLSGFESAYEDKHIVRLSDSFQEEDFEVANVKIPGQTISIRMGSANQQMTKPFSFKGKSWAMYEDEDELDYSTVDLSWTRENSGVDLEAENKALKAEVARLKTALAIQEKMARKFKRGSPDPTGKTNGQDKCTPCDSPPRLRGKRTKTPREQRKKKCSQETPKEDSKSRAQGCKPSNPKGSSPTSGKAPSSPKERKGREGTCKHYKECDGTGGLHLGHQQDREGGYPNLNGAQAVSKTRIEQQFEEFYDFLAPSKRCFQDRLPPKGFRWSGRCKAWFHAAPEKDAFSKWGKARVEASDWLRRQVSGFGWPSYGSEAELRSLDLQADRRHTAQTKASVPTDDKRREMIGKCVKQYAHTSLTCPDWIRSGLNEAVAYRTFLDCVRALSTDSGSGIPYSSFENRRFNLNWIDSDAKVRDLWELVWVRLNRMLGYRFSSPEQAVLDGIVDPVRIFVKGEPHKLAKLAEGRYRLIASVSLVDQLVARMLFQEQNKAELLSYKSIPSQPGLGLSTDDQVIEFTSRLARIAGAPSAEVFVKDYSRWCYPTDCSGFDWSVPMWLMEDDLKVRNLLTDRLSPEMAELRQVWLSCITNSVFCLSDGTLLSQECPGIQKSGSYNTSSSNSRMRVLMSLHAGADWALAMGDDCIEAPNSRLDAYAEMGFKCEVSDKFDFCSHIFQTPEIALPVNVGKMLFGLLNGTSPESSIEADRVNWLISCSSVLQELRHLPSKDFLELLSALCINVISEQKIIPERKAFR